MVSDLSKTKKNYLKAKICLIEDQNGNVPLTTEKNKYERFID